MEERLQVEIATTQGDKEMVAPAFPHLEMNTNQTTLCLNLQDKFISKLKDRSHSRSRCCCNLWIAAHCWTISEIMGVFFMMGSTFVVADTGEHEALSVILGVIRISWASVGLYGLRHCQPECIGGYLAVILTMAIQTVLFALTDCVIDGPSPMRGATGGLTILYNVWMVVVMYKVYKVARQCKYEYNPNLPKLSPILI